MPQQAAIPTLEQAARQLYTVVGEGCLNGLVTVDLLVEMDLTRSLDDVLAALNQTEQTVKPAEANLMDLSPDTVQLAHQYMTLVEDMERGHYDRGYTPEETDRQRVKLHNKFLAALRRDHVDCTVRTDTTVLARRIVEWVPE